MYGEEVNNNSSEEIWQKKCQQNENRSQSNIKSVKLSIEAKHFYSVTSIKTRSDPYPIDI